MKRAPIVLLKTMIILMGVGSLALCILGWASLIWNPVHPDEVGFIYQLLSGLTLAVIPFVVALYQGLRLVNFIDQQQAFSQQPVSALKKIKICAFITGALFATMLPFVAQVAQLEDAPGLMVVGLIPIFASIVVAVFAAVLQRLLQEAIEMKTENDLIV